MLVLSGDVQHQRAQLYHPGHAKGHMLLIHKKTCVPSNEKVLLLRHSPGLAGVHLVNLSDQVFGPWKEQTVFQHNAPFLVRVDESTVISCMQAADS